MFNISNYQNVTKKKVWTVVAASHTSPIDLVNA